MTSREVGRRKIEEGDWNSEGGVEAKENNNNRSIATIICLKTHSFIIIYKTFCYAVPGCHSVKQT